MTTHTTNYSYDTIPGNVEEAATDPGENHNTQKDENIRMTKKVGVLASGVLGFLCLAFLVVGRHNGHQSRTSVDTTAASSSSVSFLPLNSANRVANCQELCASRPVDLCTNRDREAILQILTSFDVSEIVFFEVELLLALCLVDEQVCVEECSSAALLSCDNIRETTYTLCLLWNCRLLQNHLLDQCVYDEEDDCLADANTVFAQQHCTNMPTVAPTPTPPPVPLPAGADCSSTAECAVPSGLTHGVCRDGRCQSGESGSSCGVTSDCVAPQGLDHGVCRQGKCQRGVYKDYCGKDSDCVSNNCVGATDIAKCKH